GVDAHDDLAGARVDAHLVGAAALPGHAAVDGGEGEVDEVPDARGAAGGDHVVVGVLVPEHPVHRLHVVGRVAPVPASVEVAEVQHARPPGGDAGHPEGDLAGDELGPAQL